MNKQTFFMISLSSLLFVPCFASTTKLESKKYNSNQEKKLPVKELAKKRPPEEKIWFRYKDAPLIDIINELANKKNINVVFPAGKEALVTKLTFQYPQKITLTEAWRRLLSILKMCGYTIANENDFYIVTGSDPSQFKDANRQPYPLYSHVKVEDLPHGDEKIRYIHYFTNLQVGGGGNSGGSSGIMPLLQALLSKDATIVTDPSSNGLVITDYARNIASTIDVINELDSHGFTDAIDFIQLKYTSAQTVAQLFQQLINSNQPQQQGQQYGVQPSTSLDNSQSQYFAKSTRIVAETRTNSLILIGKKEALEQARSFIEKNIDIPLGTGESILHIYDLQYLKAPDFLPVLQSIVSSSNNQTQQGSYGTQSSGTVQNANGEQYFQGVIIAAEQTGGGQQNLSNNSGWGASNSGTLTAPAQAPQTSNRLVIAARRQDWIRIKKLIEELDKPQLQVAIEALIVDLTLSENKILATQMRNKNGLNIKNTNFQTSNIGSVVLDGGSSTQSANALMANLLSLTSGSSNLVSGATAGSLIVSFKDKATNGMWLVTQLLSYFQDVKVLSQPFIVAMNNQNSSFTSQDIRQQLGDVTTSLGGSVQNQVPKTATLGISVTPLISSSGKINLGVDIQVGEYGSSTETFNRQLQTNANINDGEVLILGGLTKTTVADSVNGTPLLKDIPLLGWFFKQKSKTTTKEHLLIFLCPRIIHTMPNKFLDPYTQEKIMAMNKGLLDGENFDTLKDPITHWFFGSPDSDIATRRIHTFENKLMYSSSQDYLADKQRAGVKTITINPTKKIDDRTIMKTSTHLPEPSIKTEKVAKEIAKANAAENYIKVEKPAKKKPSIQSNLQKKSSKTTTSEEDELRSLFASLDVSTV